MSRWGVWGSPGETRSCIWPSVHRNTRSTPSTRSCSSCCGAARSSIACSARSSTASSEPSLPRGRPRASCASPTSPKRCPSTPPSSTPPQRCCPLSPCPRHGLSRALPRGRAAPPTQLPSYLPASGRLLLGSLVKVIKPCYVRTLWALRRGACGRPCRAIPAEWVWGQDQPCGRPQWGFPPASAARAPGRGDSLLWSWSVGPLWPVSHTWQ